MRYRFLATLTAVLGAVAPPAAAQQTVAPRPLFRGTVARDAPWLALLREAHARGSQATLLSVATEFLADLSRAPEVSGAPSRNCCDPRQHVVQVAFLASEAADAPLVRLFVHKDAVTRAALPGIRGPETPLFEVFVAEDLSVRLDSVYHSTPLEHPLAEESGHFVKLVLGKLALPLGASTIATRVADVMGAATRSPQDAAMRATAPPLAVTISRVDLPDRRAKITIEHTLWTSDPARHIRVQAEWIADTALREALVAAALDDTPGDSPDTEPRVDGGRNARAACSTMADHISAAAARALEAGACVPLKPEPGGCFKAVAAAMSGAYEESAGAPGGCPPDDAFPLVRRFLSVVPARLTSAKGSVVLANAPKSHWSFGVSTAFITSIRTDNAKPRTRISSGRIVVDPFDRVLAMGIVNFIPAGYDPASARMSPGERVRLFGGVAFAPHFGASGGASWSLNRYIGLNAGYALLVYDTPRPGETIDAPPSAEHRAAPFELAGTHALFVGLTYNIR